MAIAGIQQQRRLANKVVKMVYGVVTNGIRYECLRLDDALCLQVSRQYLTAHKSDRKEVSVCSFKQSHNPMIRLSVH